MDAVSLSGNVEKNRDVVAASGYAEPSEKWRVAALRAIVQNIDSRQDPHKNGTSQALRAVVQHIDGRQVEKGQKADGFTLFERITKLKCVKSEIKS